MNEKRECKIIQDLLPNYVEKLTDEETNKYIEEHLKSCKECSKILENMKKKIEISDPKRQEKEVKFLKKYNRKLRILSGIILLIIMIYIIYIIRNVAILAGLVNKANKIWDFNNTHITTYAYEGIELTVVDTYYKDGKILSDSTRIRNIPKEIKNNPNYVSSDILKLISYYDGERQTIYAETNGAKIAYFEDNLLPSISPVPPLYFESPYELIFKAATSFITKVECNKKECYFVDSWWEKTYYDKQTGLTVRDTTEKRSTLDKTFDIVIDYEYEFGKVEDKDLIPPDISEYNTVYNQ